MVISRLYAVGISKDNRFTFCLQAVEADGVVVVAVAAASVVVVAAFLEVAATTVEVTDHRIALAVAAATVVATVP